jgi:HSP20 family protein
MKHHSPTELTIASRPLPEKSFLQSIEEMENKIARRAYELFAASGFTDGHDLEDWLFAEFEVLGKTPVELAETENELTVTAGLPGFAEKDIAITVEPRRVVITGKREEDSESKKKGETVYSERSSEVFRAIDLPAEVDVDKAKATLSKGELEITLPRKETGKKIGIGQKVA